MSKILINALEEIIELTFGNVDSNNGGRVPLIRERAYKAKEDYASTTKEGLESKAEILNRLLLRIGYRYENIMETDGGFAKDMVEVAEKAMGEYHEQFKPPSSAPETKEGLRWVKASERLPDEIGQRYFGEEKEELYERALDITIEQLVRTQEKRNEWQEMCERLAEEMRKAEWDSPLYDEVQKLLSKDFVPSVQSSDVKEEGKDEVNKDDIIQSLNDMVISQAAEIERLKGLIESGWTDDLVKKLIYRKCSFSQEYFHNVQKMLDEFKADEKEDAITKNSEVQKP